MDHTPAFKDELDSYLRARFTLIIVVTQEESRLIETVKSLCESNHWACLAWDAAEGFQALAGRNLNAPSARDPITALEQVEKGDDGAVYIFKDFHDVWKNELVKRKLRNVVQRLRYTRKSILVTTPISRVPDELRDEVVIIDYPSPNQAELEAVLSQITQTPNIAVQLTAAGREKLIQAALGLTASQAGRAFARSVIAGKGKLDERSIDLVTEEKKQIIRESEALEFYSVSESMADVGGLGVLKEWLGLRERAFTREAREYGLPSPKGIALIGIPGTGKSLTAKMIAGQWRLPLLRLDVGALFGSLVGESEERARRALKLAETLAPCLVWIDEMEKALAHGGLDSGTSTRVFGTILTWMQEKTAACFVIATANNISALPPELLRKGRFDEIFFLDLPTEAERREIFSVHLRKRSRLTADYDLGRLAEAAEGYVGAEIEQAVIDAMYLGFNAGREFTTEDILESLRRQVPLSVAQRETIQALRNWLHEGRAQSASFRELRDAEQQFVPLEIDRS